MIYAVNFDTHKFKTFTTFAEMELFIMKNQEKLADMAELTGTARKKLKDPRKARKEIESAFKSEVKAHMVTVDNYTYMDTLQRMSNHSNRI